MLVLVAAALAAPMPTCDYPRSVQREPLPAREVKPLVFPSALDPRVHLECDVQFSELAFAGDVMMHKPQIASAMVRPGKYSLDGAFDAVAPVLSDAELAFVNLETQVAGLDLKGFEDHYTGFPRFNSPGALLDALKEAGVDVAQTANNHSLDRNYWGHRNTLDAVEARGMAHTGTWRNEEERLSEPYWMVRLDSGIQLAFLAYTFCVEVPGVWPKRPWSVNLAQTTNMVRDIHMVKEAGADVVIVGVHWGPEYREWPVPQDDEVARVLAQAGADVIYGHHPHVVGTSEVLTTTTEMGVQRDTLFLYSLGNFISSMRRTPTDAGVIARVTLATCPELGRTWLAGVRFTPTWVDTHVDGRRRYRVVPNPPPGSWCTGAGLDAGDCEKMEAAARAHARLIAVEQWDLGTDPLPIVDTWNARMFGVPWAVPRDDQAVRLQP